MPVALQPTWKQSALQNAPSYVIYWPLFVGGAAPDNVQDRRSALTGYVAAVLMLPEVLTYAMRNIQETQATIGFTTSSILAGAGEIAVASFVPGRGILGGPPPVRPLDPSAITLNRDFTALHQHWTLAFRFPGSFVAPMHHGGPELATALAVLATLGMAALSWTLTRRHRLEAARQVVLIDLMRQQELTNETLAAANQQLAAREQAAAELARARTRFLAVASHDLRQPLHALALFTAALERRVAPGIALKLVANIRELTQSMQRMFTSLLDLSRLDAGAIVAQARPYLAADLVDRLATEFATEAAAKGLRLRRAGRFPTVDTDPGLLESVLRNLIGNAIKFTDHGGILIAGRAHAAALTIEIYDTGPGIDPAHLTRIFDEFERLEATASRPGFGLGLPIVSQLCKLIDAELGVRSRLGHGSCFSVTLRRAAAAARPPSARLAHADRAPQGLRILIVDNDDDVQRALSLDLEDRGCVVQAASDGTEANSRAHASWAPDLIILDVNLGTADCDGLDVAAAVLARRPDQAILLITGATDPEMLARISRSTLPVLFKPVDPEQLWQAVTALVARAPAPG